MLTSPLVRFPAVLALLSQLSSLLVSWLLLLVLARLLGWHVSLLTAAWLQGLLAAVFGHLFGLSRWWLPINLTFVPGLVLLQDHALPPWLLLVGFIVLLLLNWNALTERVPLYLTGTAAEQRLIERLATLPAGFRFVDLGSGLGGTLLRLARAYPTAQFVGVETAPLTFALCWLRCLLQRNCRVRFRSFWREPLGNYEVVYCFLSPAPMSALWLKACEEMRPGALLISNSFEVPGVAAEEVLAIDDWRHSRLLLWRPGANVQPDGGPVSS
ncbi:class I SAM-dependent methyltransferase [Pseudomonas knackmussii]|uniref:Class I SAM-dependent methyltransferase n=1 Tax=Pseudomonas knackmussii TaxID=65741 RepID=A0ABY4KN93_9PSED|nr:class I SAM-dependent methyltransferase [Pseudomonas knackmussii]UPQ82326.1 class I SAM-dependent methyltransferase [Pseudomonas knackmussii]